MQLDNVFSFRDPSSSDEEGEVKPFLDHLEDLRWMFIKMVIALGSAMILAFGFRRQLVQIVQWPLASIDPELLNSLQALGVADSMTISIQLALYSGIIVSFPVLLYFIAEFVLPALTQKERYIVLPAVGIGFGLFLTGVFFSYFIVLPKALAFFYADAQKLQWTPTWTVREYYSFVTNFTIAFGLSFELPVAVLALVKMGVVNREMLARGRAGAMVLIFIFAAVITPTQDIFTLMLMGVPMFVLYEICIWIAWFMDRKAARLAKEQGLDLDPEPEPSTRTIEDKTEEDYLDDYEPDHGDDYEEYDDGQYQGDPEEKQDAPEEDEGPQDKKPKDK